MAEIMDQMNRRFFLTGVVAGATGLYFPAQQAPQTKHVILVINGGARKKDYYETPGLSPNIQRIAAEGTVFEEGHCENVGSHETAFTELINGLPAFSLARSLSTVPSIMQSQAPGVVMCRDSVHDV